MKVKKMFHVCRVEGIVRTAIDVKGNPNKYGKPKDFETKAKADEWIKKHTFKGMSWEYEIYER